MPSYVRAPLQDHAAADLSVTRLRAALERCVLQLLRWQELARQRRALAALDDHMLKDLGLTRADVAQESGRWFFDDGGEPWRS